MTLPDNGATEENISAESPFPFLIHITGTSVFPLLNAEVQRKPANKKSSVFLKKISKIRFDILCITFKPPEMPVLKVVI